MNGYYESGNSRNIRVSSSSFKIINPDEGGDPTSFIKWLDGKLEKKETTSMNNGTVIHNYVENKDEFYISNVVKPGDGKPTDIVMDLYRNNYTREDYLDGLEEAAKRVGYSRIPKYLENKQIAYLDHLHEENNSEYVLTVDDRNKVEGAINSLEEDLNVQKEFEIINNDGVMTFKELWIEFPIVIKDVKTVDIVTGEEEIKNITLTGKALIDYLRIDYNYLMCKITDLKTTAKLSNYEWSFKKFRTYRQLAWYRKAVIQLLKGNAIARDKNGNQILIPKASKPFKIYTHVVAVETSGNFNCGIVPISKKWIDKGIEESNSLCRRIAWHSANSEWIRPMELVLNNSLIKIDDPIDYKEEIQKLNNEIEKLQFKSMRNKL